jgi:hypothetical protein
VLREPSRLAPLLRRLTAQPATAVGGLALGILLLAISAWPHIADVLRIGGTALVAACLSLLLTTVTSREAVRQENARTAHLRARDATYSPLNAELKALRRGLAQAQNGQAAYPSAIDVGDTSELAKPRRAPWFPLVPELTFTGWGEYKQDARELDFTAHAAQVLDAVVQHAREYNATVQQAREATIPRLAAQIRVARQTLQEATTAEGIRPWLTFDLQSRDRQRRPATSSEPPLENAWYAALQDEDAPDQLAKMWVTGLFYAASGPPRTLGWLLAKRTDQAADAVVAVFPSGAAFATAPVEWVQGVLDDALPDMGAGAGYEMVWTALEALLAAVQAADATVLTALRVIREEYEGGPPLI